MFLNDIIDFLNAPAPISLAASMISAALMIKTTLKPLTIKMAGYRILVRAGRWC